MAKQSGILPIEGTIGNITFFKTKDGYRVREKSGLDPSRIFNDPQFKRVRENMQEFGRAGKTGKILRTVLRDILTGSTDGRMISRLLKKMMEVIKADSTSRRGQRNVIDGEAALLQGFEFNVHGKLDVAFPVTCTVAFDRVTGAATLDVPAFSASEILFVPEATHYRVRVGTALVNFEEGTGQLEQAASDYLPVDSELTEALHLTMQLPAATTHPVFQVINIEFWQDTGSNKYPLKNGVHNTCTIVRVDTGV
jgi:hypothetical protein